MICEDTRKVLERIYTTCFVSLGSHLKKLLSKVHEISKFAPFDFVSLNKTVDQHTNLTQQIISNAKDNHGSICLTFQLTTLQRVLEFVSQLES